MKILKLNFLVLLLVIISCKNKPLVEQSPEQFGQLIVQHLNAGSEKGFNQFLFTDSELKEVHNRELEKVVSVKELLERYKKESSEFYKRLKPFTNQNLKMDSIAYTYKDPSKKAFKPLYDPTKCKEAFMTLYFSDTKGQQQQVRLAECLKLPTSGWKLGKKPQVMN